MKYYAPLFGLALILVSGGPGLAHHSFAMFDRTKTVTIEGTVKSLQLINPHGWLDLVVLDNQGHASDWSFELGGAGQVNRTGLTRDSVKAGDVVKVNYHPLRDGSNGGQFVSVMLPSGNVVGNGRP